MEQARVIFNIRHGHATGHRPGHTSSFGQVLDSLDFIVNNYVVIGPIYKRV
ncbi:MAG: hypothetical protein BMS9Abin14_537 [Gammaproteobacteria bacterium]|nr:MAG: hypothetical protein BMS9Abin14_537 [Gammaproteobacteria bacterium]